MNWTTLPIALSLACAASAGLAADAPLRPETLRQAMGLKLGAWRTRSELVEVRVEPAPGSDPAESERAAEAIRAEHAKSPIHDQCLWDRPSGLSLPGLRVDPECDVSHLEARNGRFAFTAQCKPQSNSTVQLAVEGRYKVKKVSTRSEATAFADGGRIRIRVDTESRFTGKCSVTPVILEPPAKN